MQIHELNSFVGTPSTGDYFAIDNGEETTKLDAAVLSAIAESVAEPIAEAKAESAATLREVLVLDVASFSSLPQTVTNSSITSDMVVVNSVLGSPAAQTGDWTVTTSDGSLTVSGSISGSTTLTLYLAKSR